MGKMSLRLGTLSLLQKISVLRGQKRAVGDKIIALPSFRSLGSLN